MAMHLAITWTCVVPVHWSTHYNGVMVSAMASQITGVSIVCSIVDSGADQRKHQSFVSLAFVRGIHRSPVNSPHKRPVTRKMFPFDDVMMALRKTLSWFPPLMSSPYLPNDHVLVSSALFFSWHGGQCGSGVESSPLFPALRVICPRSGPVNIHWYPILECWECINQSRIL